ncbi:hypothetical protein FKM82_018285 [Ascaphus truei]
MRYYRDTVAAVCYHVTVLRFVTVVVLLCLPGCVGTVLRDAVLRDTVHRRCYGICAAVLPCCGVTVLTVLRVYCVTVRRRRLRVTCCGVTSVTCCVLPWYRCSVVTVMWCYCVTVCGVYCVTVSVYTVLPCCGCVYVLPCCGVTCYRAVGLLCYVLRCYCVPCCCVTVVPC